MAFVNLSLLFGGALIAIPILLHLIMRQQPKLLVFPALRFIKQRQEANRRKMQLRHWILLLLRCLAIALLAAALARPSVASGSAGSGVMAILCGVLLLVTIPAIVLAVVQRRGGLLIGGLSVAAAALLLVFGYSLASAWGNRPQVLLGDREAPVAAALVIDTSPRMAYARADKQSRLKEAQNTAEWLIQQLPSDSQVAVLESASPASVFAVDLAAAQKAVKRMQTTGAPLPLANLIANALDLLQTSQLERKEVYIFTDLNERAWRGAADAIKLDEHPEVGVYVIDVGVANPENFLLGDLKLSQQVVAQNSKVTVRVDLRHVGPGGSRKVELRLEEQDLTLPLIRDDEILTPKAVVRGRRSVELSANGSEQLEFILEQPPPGTHQGYVEITTKDGLTIDDKRYFAFHVTEAWPVLIAAPENAWTVFFTQAIAPEGQNSNYETVVIDQGELDNHRFSDYAAVCLLDPKPLTPPQWKRLADYAEQGGAVGLFLGRNASPSKLFNVPEAQRILPGPLDVQPWRAGGRDLFLDFRNYSHPVAAVFRSRQTSIPWDRFPIMKHWVLESVREGVQTICWYGNGKPALLDCPIGDKSGRAIVMTTPLSEPSAGPRRATPWNELASGQNNWPPFALTVMLMRYLTASGEEQLNFVTGEPAELKNNAATDPNRYQLFTPKGQPHDVLVNEGRISVSYTDTPGAYRLKGLRGEPVVRGFAVNYPQEASDLKRMDRPKLDEILGKDRYQFARRQEEITRVQGTQRVGREFYGLLMCLMAIVLGLEHLLSNRFYPPQRSPEPATA